MNAWSGPVEPHQPGWWLKALSTSAGWLLLLAACAAPVQVGRVDLRSAYDELNRTALSSDQLSEFTRPVLRRAALLDYFDAQPDATIAALRAQAIGSGMPWPDLYALSEMSYYEGRRTKSKAMLLASALYAYAVLFPAGDAARPSPYSGQFTQAEDFYNLALTQVLSGAGAEGVANLQSGRYEVPFGVVDVAVNQANLQFAGRTLTSFVPTMNLTVTGFQNDYRSDGLGAPLAAGLAPASQPDKGLVLPATLRVPTSAVLQMDDPRRQLTGSRLTARLSLYTIYDTADIKIDGHTVPLEYDQTAVRALFAVEGKGWTRELSGLLNNALASPNGTANDNLFALEPHRHGRIPVVLVHGTASSPLRWGDMVNDLLEDQEIRNHYEFWFFTYNTGNPIPVSANVLRHSLEDAVQSLGGVQADPALGRMVVIGHSQGGLLTKLISIDSGTKLWDAVSEKPVDELNLKPETTALPKNAQVLLREYVDEANELARTPRFYNTLTANCTNLVFGMVRVIHPGVPMDVRVLLSGYLPNYAYDLGATDTSVSFERLRETAKIHDKAVQADADPLFSARIREGIPVPR